MYVRFPPTHVLPGTGFALNGSSNGGQWKVHLRTHAVFVAGMFLVLVDLEMC